MNILKHFTMMALVAFVAIAFTACENNNDLPEGPNNNPQNGNEETPTALYSAWLGEWVLTGDNNVSNNIAIASDVVNKSIELVGLQGLPFGIKGEYSTDRNDIIFSAQVVEKSYDFGGGQVGDVVLIGVDRDGKTYGLDNGNYGIAIAGVLDDGQRAIVRYGVNTPDYPKFVAMMLVASLNGKFYSIKSNAVTPAFNAIAAIDAPGTTRNGECVMNFTTASSLLHLGEEIEQAKF